MKIQITVAGDSVYEIATELTLIAEAMLAGGRQTTQPAPEPEPEPEPTKKPRGTKKKDPEPEPKEEPEQAEAEEQDDDDDEAGEPEGAAEGDPWDVACDMLMKFWTANPDKQDDVLAVINEFGVKRFADIPRDQGPALLAKAKEIVDT